MGGPAGGDSNNTGNIIAAIGAAGGVGAFIAAGVTIFLNRNAFKPIITLNVQGDGVGTTNVRVASSGKKPFSVTKITALNVDGSELVVLYDSTKGNEEPTIIPFGGHRDFKMPNRAFRLTHSIKVHFSNGVERTVDGYGKAAMYRAWVDMVYEAVHSINGGATRFQPYDKVTIYYGDGSGDGYGLDFDPLFPEWPECGRTHRSNWNRAVEQLSAFVDKYPFMFYGKPLDIPNVPFEVVWTDKALTLMQDMDPKNFRWFEQQMAKTRQPTVA